MKGVTKMTTQEQQSQSSLQVGIARTDITPPVGILMVGFAGRGPSIGVHDPLFATALVVTDGEKKAALIGCDLLDLGAAVVEDVRKEIDARKLDIQPAHVTISCTHTHYGPDSYRSESASDVAAYRANLIYKLAGVVQEAVSNTQTVRMGVGWGISDIGINRREKRPDGQIVLGKNPDGPIDRQVGVLRLDKEDGTPLACLVNFACHPVSQGGRMQLISADFPGKMRDVVEQLIGAPCLYLQGACGNINSIMLEHSYEPARTLGTRLGCEVVKVWETIETAEAVGIAVASETVSLPQIMYGSEAEAEALTKNLTQQLEQLKASGAHEGSIYWAQRRLERTSQALESWRTGKPLQPITAELQAWRLGIFGFATAPGEVFNEIGTAIKQRSPLKNTFFLGYTNGSIGYVPTAKSYPEGGYEVTHACRVNPEAEEIITEGCLRLLHAVSAF
jgi:hypothetical protein